ncbi:MAG: HEAT repeat domain-containing protein [Deltaproteobacteria bacterium]|nr:HEAT repeat domain-containing protein [Deltaproteobacteria bacterium]
MSDSQSNVTKTRQSKTAVIDGQALNADEVEQVHEVKDIFLKLQKALKTISLYRHMRDRYAEYMQACHAALHDFMERNGMLALRVGALDYRFHGVDVFHDESREGNLCFPFYQHGVRLLMFKPGIPLDELLRFILLMIDANVDQKRSQDDLITRLWKAELQHIEWVVVESFKACEDEDEEQVKIEVDKVVRYLYRQLQSNSEDIARFARVSLEDLDMKLESVESIRGAVVEGVTATPADKERVQLALSDEENERLLPKMVVILFQLLELDTTPENFEDVAEGFIQLLDAMLLSGDFASIGAMRERFEQRIQKAQKPQLKQLLQNAADRLVDRMADPQRLSTISQMLNSGAVKDPAGLKAYLTSLPEGSVPQICDTLESIEIPPNRRLVCDVLVELGPNLPQVFSNRLQHPSSNVVKDMLYVIDKINFPNKFQMFAHVLTHPNAILRLEALATIGRNPSEECFKVILSCLTGSDQQLRSAAARMMPNYEPNRAIEVLLQIIGSEEFEKRERNEQKNFLLGLAQINHPQSLEYLNAVFAQKGGLLNRKKADERKLVVIEALSMAPAIPIFQFLAAQAQNLETNSKEVAEAARVAALEMRERLVGGRSRG